MVLKTQIIISFGLSCKYIKHYVRELPGELRRYIIEIVSYILNKKRVDTGELTWLF